MSKPDMLSPEWTPYVLSLLSEGEMFNGMPKVEGLKRILQKEVGPIVDMQPILGQCYALLDQKGKPFGYHATVGVRVSVKFGEGDIRTFCGVADKNPNNQNQSFNIHASACAETAALGRAYKQALNLVGVLTAEEIQGADKGLSIQVPDEVVTDAQLAAINTIAKKLKLNVCKIIAEHQKASGVKIISISSMPREFAAQIVQQLNGYQRKMDTIPAHLKQEKYDASWYQVEY
jgi:hypothetical protein